MDETKDNLSHNVSEITNGFEENYESLQKLNVEFSGIKSEIIKKNLVKLDSVVFTTIFKSALPSLLLLILSFFVGVSNIPLVGNIFNSIALYISPSQPLANIDVNPIDLWWFPFVIYIIFIACALRANASIKREIQYSGASEASITRIIDRYSGVVDGIGTALPLLGAAILLISIEKGPAIFLGFAVPFEIKSIIILAMAKLFDSVFDALALKYQEVQEEIKNAEKIYYYQKQSSLQQGILEKLIKQSQQGHIDIRSSVSEDHLRKIYETMKSSEQLSLRITQLVSELSNLKLPDERLLKELENTSKVIGETISGFRDSNVLRSLDNLAYMSGKR